MSKKAQFDVIIRADGSPEIGAGHVLRCIALAQGLKRSGLKVLFLTTPYSEGIVERIASEDIATEFVSANGNYSLERDLNQTIDKMKLYSSKLLITDGYHFSSTYQKAIKDWGFLLMCIDDVANTHYYADIVLNQNINANSAYYSREPYTALLIGTEYALIRDEFLKYRHFGRHFPERARNILVTLGGADPENYSLKILQALELLNDKSLNVIVAVGLANPNIGTLRKFVKNSKMKFTIPANTQRMPELMKEADLSISAAGTTTWELCLIGVPGIVGILAENQVGVAEHLKKYGAFKSVGWFRDVSLEKMSDGIKLLIENRTVRSQMARKAKQLVDGLGVERVVNEINKRIKQQR